MSKAEAFWNEVLAEGSVGVGGGVRWTEAKKQLAKLPASLAPDTVKRICELVLNDCKYHLWGALSEVAPGHAETIVGCLRGRQEVQARLMVAGYEGQGVDGLRSTSSFIRAVEKSSNWPGLLKRLPEISTDRALMEAARGVVASQSTDPSLGSGNLIFWALTYVVARDRPATLDEVAQRYQEWDSISVLDRMRKALSG
jgi:hypothetical protein